MLSILMPAKNAAPYIREAIQSVTDVSAADCEIVVVDDGSADETRQIAESCESHDPRVSVVSNPGSGKIDALNVAFARSRGDLITTLDSDDCLDRFYFDCLESAPSKADAFVRDYIVTDEHLNAIRPYFMRERYFRSTFGEAVSGLVSLPRGTWTVRRWLADRIFPIPRELPFEDVWFSLVVKRFATSVSRCSVPNYYYRQHPGQTFGGVLNHQPEKTRFRAGRLYEYARLLPAYAERFNTSEMPNLDHQCVYLSLMARERLSVIEILRAPLSFIMKARLLLFRKLWILVGLAKRLQWWLAKGSSRRKRAQMRHSP